MTEKPKVKVVWAEPNGIYNCDGGWTLEAPEGYEFEVRMDDCTCKPYGVMLVRKHD